MKADLRGKSIAVYRMGKYFINDVLGRGLICLLSPPKKVFDNEKTNNPIKNRSHHNIFRLYSQIDNQSNKSHERGFIRQMVETATEIQSNFRLSSGNPNKERKEELQAPEGSSISQKSKESTMLGLQELTDTEQITREPTWNLLRPSACM